MAFFVYADASPTEIEQAVIFRRLQGIGNSIVGESSFAHRLLSVLTGNRRAHRAT
jgi:hypothetical protein